MKYLFYARLVVMWSKAGLLLMVSAIIAVTSFAEQVEAGAQERQRPNILLIVADDMGWSDIEPFGGEIRTPHIARLASEGIQFTQFYVGPACSPTRSMLLSGTDNHLTGMGTNAEVISEEQRGKPGYEGYLNDRVISVAETLATSGYETFMAGKWHLGEKPEHWPDKSGNGVIHLRASQEKKHLSIKKILFFCLALTIAPARLRLTLQFAPAISRCSVLGQVAIRILIDTDRS